MNHPDKTPLLLRANQSLMEALIRAKFESNGVETFLTQDIEDALHAIEAAIEAVNGAKEDAHRMEGRANVDTELLEELA